MKERCMSFKQSHPQIFAAEEHTKMWGYWAESQFIDWIIQSLLLVCYSRTASNRDWIIQSSQFKPACTSETLIFISALILLKTKQIKASQSSCFCRERKNIVCCLQRRCAQLQAFHWLHSFHMMDLLTYHTCKLRFQKVINQITKNEETFV